MSVQSQVRSIQYSGNGSTVTPYPVPFLFYDPSHLQVFLDGSATPLVLDVDYTVSGSGDDEGGEFVTTEAYNNTHTLSVYRVVPVTQLARFANASRFPSGLFEQALDLLVMAMQQVQQDQQDEPMRRRVQWNGNFEMPGQPGDYSLSGGTLAIYSNFTGSESHSWFVLLGANAAS